MVKTGMAPQFVGAREIRMRQREWPEPGPGQLLLRVRANAICGTDRGQFFNGSEVTAGHEAAGEVLMAGTGTTLKAGTRGVVYFKDFCGRCRSCLAGHTSMCMDKRAATGFDQDGGYGPYELISESQFFPITDDVPFSLATMLLDAMGTTGHAVSRAQQVRPEMESAYVAGAGPIGIGLLIMLRIRLGEGFPIYISDLSPWRRDLAETLGGIPLDANDEASIRAAAPVDVSFDSAGRRVARQLAIDVLGHRGVFMAVGGQEGLAFEDVGAELLPRELSILGSEYFDFREFEENLNHLCHNRELIEQMVSHVFPISELATAFETFLSGETGKVVVVQDGDE